MSGFSDYQNSHSIYSEICDVAKGIHTPSIHQCEADYVTKPCENPFRANIITCKDEYKDEFLQEVNGLSLNVSFSTLEEELPSYIPILDYNTIRDHYVIDSPIIGISLRDILSDPIVLRAGTLHEKNGLRIPKAIIASDMFKRKKVILFNTGPDSLIESVWHKRNAHHFYDKINDIGFMAVCGFNFSVFRYECAFAQSLNIKRSLYSSFEIDRNCGSVIPHVYAVNKFQLKRWIDWFVANPSVKYFTMNCQLQKREFDISNILIVIKSILSRLTYLHVILQGFNIKKLPEFGSYLERIHVADKTTAKNIQWGKGFAFNSDTGLLSEHYFDKKNRRFLLQESIAIKERFIEYTKQQTSFSIHQYSEAS